MSTAPVVRAAWVGRTQADAFRIFTDEIGAWWPLPTHGLFGDRAGGVHFRAGALVEQATDGREVVWGEVLAWEAPERLVVTWHPGRDASDASEVEVSFEPEGNGTRVIIEHRGWEAFGEDAAQRRLSYAGPNAWGYVLDHFADVAEPHPDAVEVSALVYAYEAFFAEAETGSFDPAPPDQWGAEEVVAHVALNDAAMVAVCQALVHGNTPRFENVECQDPEVLSRVVAEAGGLSELIARGRSASAHVIAAVQRLSSEQSATEVHCRLIHDGDVVLDDLRPWAAIAVDTQAAMHLPAHTDQLRNLRA
jgi:uncharacterized protein YndB with AHSA1/START domain